MGRKWCYAAVMASAMLLAAVVPARGEQTGQTFSFGVVPQQSAGEVARLWTPILTYLGEKAGMTLQLETAKDIATFEQRLTAGEYDFVYSNPLTYAVQHHARGYEAFAKEKDRILVGILVVRKDSPYRSLTDLAGSDLAFPAAAAAAASVIPRAHLDKLHVPFTPHYVGSHDSVILAVAKGLYAAGGGVTRTFDMLQPAVREQLRVLWTTPGYPPHPFIARRGVPADAVKRLKAAMLAADAEPAGREALKPLAFGGIGAARDADYDPLRALGLKLPDTPAQ
ncbi:MAG: phosphate/phosphite/phosphonate ABC transporter substrate-binding protein [Rhodocyclales bacterium]|nr:phosphate/phosphite/phosphonate ABC transporter substrate-binding protein [Rhodocyclales bacterium]